MENHLHMNLRRPTGKEISSNRVVSQELRRNQRRQAMRDILCRNFFHKYMINTSLSEERALAIEKEVAYEI